jgi:hypothetical protein
MHAQKRREAAQDCPQATLRLAATFAHFRARGAGTLRSFRVSTSRNIGATSHTSFTLEKPERSDMIAAMLRQRKSRNVPVGPVLKQHFHAMTQTSPTP